MHTITVASLFAQLAALAPSIALSVSREIDHSFRWDRDGPDPRDDGFDAYNITVTARAIVAGQSKDGDAYMGGHYAKPEDPTGDLGGYLPQLLRDALKDLWNQRGVSLELTRQINEAINYLSIVMRDEYDAQRAGTALLAE